MIETHLQAFTWGDYAIAAFLFIIFLALIREITTWYWKINSIVNMLQRIELTLETIEHTLKEMAKKGKEK